MKNRHLITQLQDLQKLALAREMMTARDLAKAVSLLKQLERDQQVLKAPGPEPQDPTEALLAEKHAVWKSQKLRELAIEMAQCVLAKRESSAAHGRAVAEKEVVEQLIKRAVDAEKREQNRRASYIS